MSKIISHILIEIFQKLFVLCCKETLGFSSKFSEDIVNIRASLIKSNNVSWGIESFKSLSIFLKLDFNQLTKLRIVKSKRISSKNLEILVYMSKLFQVIDVVFVCFDVET